MGGMAYAAINEDLDAAGIAEEAAMGTSTAIRITYTAGASSTGPKDVVALLPNGRNPGEWLGAVQPRPGRCTVINVTDANGIFAARTGDAQLGRRGAEDGFWDVAERPGQDHIQQRITERQCQTLNGQH
jgi:hypothetical protein